MCAHTACNDYYGFKMHQCYYCTSLKGTDLLYSQLFFFKSKFFAISASQHHLLDLVQVVGPSVINIMEEACCYHGHYLQVGVVPLQHSRLSTQRRTQSGQKQRKSSEFSI